MLRACPMLRLVIESTSFFLMGKYIETQELLAYQSRVLWMEPYTIRRTGLSVSCCHTLKHTLIPITITRAQLLTPRLDMLTRNDHWILGLTCVHGVRLLMPCYNKVFITKRLTDLVHINQVLEHAIDHTLCSPRLRSSHPSLLSWK